MHIYIYIYIRVRCLLLDFSNRRTPWLLVSCCFHIMPAASLSPQSGPWDTLCSPFDKTGGNLRHLKNIGPQYTNPKIGWGYIYTYIYLNQSCPWRHSEVIMSSRFLEVSMGHAMGVPLNHPYFFGWILHEININRPSSYGGISEYLRHLHLKKKKL